jgi:hypothetical protein
MQGQFEETCSASSDLVTFLKENSKKKLPDPMAIAKKKEMIGKQNKELT